MKLCPRSRVAVFNKTTRATTRRTRALRWGPGILVIWILVAWQTPTAAQTAADSPGTTTPSPSAQLTPPTENDPVAAGPDSTSRPLNPEIANPSSEAKLVWTPMTTPNGHEVLVLRPEEETTSPAVSSQPAPNAGQRAGLGPTPGSAPASSPKLGGIETFFDQGSNSDHIAAFGVYGGYPSALGFQTVLPTDGALAVRMGLTGFPKLGWLWTPGFEVRFGQVKGQFSTDGAYHFSNLYIGQTTSGADEDLWGAESGFGYRWILPDRRGVRWIAAVELGGRWTTESGLPDTPSLRAFWMIAAP